MAADDVSPSEMPDTPYDPIAPLDGAVVGGVALDGDTVERLLAGRLHPDDAPPGYAEVAWVLRAAAGPPCPDELAGQPAAMAAFRTSRHRARVRSRLVTVALAGTLTIGGLWTADGAHAPLGFLSPSGSGSGAPAAAPRSGGAGSGPAWRAALPPVGSRTGTGNGGSPGLPSPVERVIAGHGGGGPARAGGSAGGVRPAKPAKGQAAKPPKPPKAKPGKPEKAGTAERGGGKRK